jgi:hypothetical protein
MGLKSEVTFSAQDASDQMNLLGTILFAYGACTAGTPAEDNFSSSAEAKRIASKAFLARLAQKLLCLPQGGCLAVIGHVDQAWSNSFLSEEGGNPTSDAGVFVKTLSRLMQGATAGLALEDFNRRYSYFTSLLAEELIAVNFSNQPRDNRRLLLMRNQTIDARNYILLGDPAVRLPVHSDQPYQELPADWSRPQIGPVRAPEWVAPATGAQEGAIEMPGSGLPEGTLQPEEAFQTGGTLRAEPAPRSVKPREIQPPGETSAVPKGMTPDPLAQVSLDHIAQALLKGQKIKLPGEKQGREHKVEKSKNPGL